jgi:hypothetical protein
MVRFMRFLPVKWPGVISNIPTLRKTWRRAISQRLPLFNDNASPARITDDHHLRKRLQRH